jgi:KaiC/GvpD/RAD55 family RecA-like ATPase
MDEQTLSDRWAAVGRGELISPPDSSTSRNKNADKPVLYKPLTDAVPDYVHWAQNPDERIYFGFNDLDMQVRGVAPGEMCLINGFSHSGKTLFLLQILVANRDKVVVYFCPDEPRTLTLIKLACLVHKVPGKELEQMISNNDQAGLEMLESTAREWFPNLAVFDQFMNLSDMEKSLIEVDTYLGKPALMVFDYLDLLSCGEETIPAKANTIKAFGKRHNIPLIVLHQSSRTAGADGKKQTISSGAYGGEQQASHIVGVRRKKFEIEGQIREIVEKLDKSSASERLLERLDMLRYDAQLHENTVTINLVKCKRQDAHLLDDMDYEIEAGTGRLLRLAGPVPPSMSADNAKVESDDSDNDYNMVLADW